MPLAQRARRAAQSRSSRSPTQKGLAFAVEARGRRAREHRRPIAQRLQQILQEPLSNAFKFTERGEVELACRRAGDGRVRFAVRDTGIGIPPEQQRGDLRGVPPGRRHHQPQVRRHRPRPVDLARAGAAARRRLIDVESAAGRGSTFTSRCCRSRSQARPTQPRERPRPRSGRAAAARSAARARRAPAPATRRRAAPARPAAHRRRPRRRCAQRSALILVVEDDPNVRQHPRTTSPTSSTSTACIAPTADEGAGARARAAAERHPARRRPAGRLRPVRARAAQARSARPATCRSTWCRRPTTPRPRWSWARSATRSSPSRATSSIAGDRAARGSSCDRELRRVLVVEDDER